MSEPKQEDIKRLPKLNKNPQEYTANDVLYILKLHAKKDKNEEENYYETLLYCKLQQLQHLRTYHKYPKLLLQAYFHPENVHVATDENENQGFSIPDPYPQRLVPLPGVIAAYLENNQQNPSGMISQLRMDFGEIRSDDTPTTAEQSFETFLDLLEVAIEEAVKVGHSFSPEQMKSLVKGADIFEAEFRREREGYVTDYSAFIEGAFDDNSDNVQLLMAAWITKAMAEHLSEIEGYDGDKLQAVQATAATLMIESVNSRQGGTTR
ncbi:MAG: hypothetical protein ACK5UY_01475 [Holosporales bacterium]